MTCWYRFEETTYACELDTYGDIVPGSGAMKVEMYSYAVLKHTPTGVWLGAPHGRRFVSRKWRKMFACPTPEQAMVSFIARKDRQISILLHRLEAALNARQLAVIASRGGNIAASRKEACFDWNIKSDLRDAVHRAANRAGTPNLLADAMGASVADVVRAITSGRTSGNIGEKSK